jgi:hypothetical protein
MPMKSPPTCRGAAREKSASPTGKIIAKPTSLTTWKPMPHSSETFSPVAAALALATASSIGAPAAIDSDDLPPSHSAPSFASLAR